jgi:hypothetical protein
MPPSRNFFCLRPFSILIRTPEMKCAAVAMAVYIAFPSHAFAVLRPLFPAKAGPPFGVEAIVKGNGSVPPLVKRAPATVRR